LDLCRPGREREVSESIIIDDDDDLPSAMKLTIICLHGTKETKAQSRERSATNCIQTVTTVEAGKGEIGYGPIKSKSNDMITMTMQMEGTWGPSNCEQDTSSTESPVHRKGSVRRSE
jgi:hypothetical protein